MADKIEKHAERWNWIPSRRGLRYMVVDKETGEIVNDCNGYGFKTQDKCVAWIRFMQQQVGIDVDKEFIKPAADIETCIRVLESKGYKIIPPKH